MALVDCEQPVAAPVSTKAAASDSALIFFLSMKQVHNLGKSVLVRESLEKAEHYVHQLQKYSLHATMERDA